MAKLPNQFPYRRTSWIKAVSGPSKLARFATSKIAQWIPNSHIRLKQAIHLYGQKNFNEWNGKEQISRHRDTPPDPPWKWEATGNPSNPEYFIISEENQIIEKSEKEAINWWRDIEPILINEWNMENKCRERWDNCVHLFRSELSTGKITAFLLDKDGSFQDIPLEQWRSARGASMIINGNAELRIHRVVGSHSVNGTIVLESDFLAEKEEVFEVQSNRSTNTELIDENIFPYLAYMIQVAENGPVGNTTRVSKKVLEQYIEQNWPPELGVPTPTKITNMATFLRRPIDERGGLHAKGQDN